MANVKITDLTQESSPASTDVLPIVDVSADVTKKITVADLLESAGSGSANAPGFAFDGDRNTGMYRVSANVLGFATGGSGRLFIDGSGNIGVGTSSPAQKVEISAANPRLRLTDTDSTAANATSYLEFHGSNDRTAVIYSNDDGLNIQTDSAGGNKIVFLTNGTNEKMRIDGNGRLLINVSSRRSVGDSFNPNNFIFMEGAGTGFYQAVTAVANRADGDGPVYILAKTRGTTTGSNTAVQENDSLGAIRWAGADGTDLQNRGAEVRCKVDGSVSSDTVPTRLEFLTTPTNSPVTRMVIKSNGNIGVGVSSPSQKLDVSGSVQSSGGFIFGSTNSYLYESADDKVSLRLGSNGPYVEFIDTGSNSMEFGNASGEIAITAGGSEKIRIKSNGNVGIGDTNPEKRLTVADSGEVAIQIEDTANDGFKTRFFNRERIGASTDPTFGIYDASNSRTWFRYKFSNPSNQVASNTVLSILESGGNVGIGGATTPSVKLEISRLGSNWTGADAAAGTCLFVHNGNNASSSPAAIQISGGPSAASTIYFGDDDDADVGKINYQHNDNSLRFDVNASEALRIQSNGRILKGISTARQVGAADAAVQIEGNSYATSAASITRISNNSVSPVLTFGKARADGDGDPIVVNDDDMVGLIEFAAYDGSDLQSRVAGISALIDGTPGSNDVPGRLSFRTTADGSAAPTEHFRIASNGDLTATDTTIGSISDARLKTNVSEFTYDLEDFKQYRPKTFDWINPKLHGNHEGQRGFIAQDVEAIDSYWVDEQVIDNDSADAELLEDDCISKTLKLGKKDAMYVSVIQQLLAKVETLEAKVAALEAGN